MKYFVSFETTTKRESRAIVLILKKKRKKTRIFTPNVTRSSAITCTDKEVITSPNNSNYVEFFGHLCKRGYDIS